MPWYWLGDGPPGGEVGVERHEYQCRTEDVEQASRPERDGALPVPPWIFFINGHVSPDHAGATVPGGSWLIAIRGFRTRACQVFAVRAVETGTTCPATDGITHVAR
jgi:hypothetical protein